MHCVTPLVPGLTTSVWWVYLKADERNRLQSTVSKTVRYSYLPRSFCTLDELREDADEQLFLSRHSPYHVLHRLLLNLKNLIRPTIYANALTILLYRWTSMQLWNENFVYRMVFRDIYLLLLTSVSTHCSMCVCYMSLKDLLTYYWTIIII